MGGNYTTSQNIYVPSTNWYFANGVKVNFTGSGNYFIDSSGELDGALDFNVFGYINFSTTNGGFLQNIGTYANTATNKTIYVEAFKILGSTTGSTLPLINHIMTYPGTGYARISTSIKLNGAGAIIASAQQDCIYYNGSYLSVDLNGGSIYYGVDQINGIIIGSTGGSVVNHNCTDTTGKAGSSFFSLRNGYILSDYANDHMIIVSNVFSTIILDNLYSITPGGSATRPKYFLNIATNNNRFAGQTDSSIVNYDFLMKSVYLQAGSFSVDSGSPGAVIKYTGSSSFNTFDYLNMENCVLYPGCQIDYTHLALGARTANGLEGTLTGSSAGAFNIIEGRHFVYGLPTSTTGLHTGMLWNSSGIIHIV